MKKLIIIASLFLTSCNDYPWTANSNNVDSTVKVTNELNSIESAQSCLLGTWGGYIMVNNIPTYAYMRLKRNGLAEAIVASDGRNEVVGTSNYTLFNREGEYIIKFTSGLEYMMLNCDTIFTTLDGNFLEFHKVK